MRGFSAFFKKEWLEWVRTGRVTVLVIIFCLFGIMNPAIAKVTPWLMEMMSESLENTGLTVTAVTVDAMTSWAQFYKNIPMALIVFLIMVSSIFTSEYQKGTLIQVVTKGVPRHSIVFAKLLVIMTMWCICYWICFGITYAYNAYFWDNSIADNIIPAAVIIWLFGIFMLACIVFFSAIADSSTNVMLMTGAVFVICYIFNFLPEAEKYSPVYLLNSMNLMTGAGKPGDFLAAILITSASCVILNIFSFVFFDRKKL
ncbi:MAG: ABC transporter permease subunit [Coprococcus sp.]